jgi:8-oxo-dGTP pyrophosphatase MutT (NUDIX family)
MKNSTFTSMSTSTTTFAFDSYQQNLFCNNCGKYSHMFHQCKQPITSIGIIAFRSNMNNIEYLLIRRKNTLGFLDFMRGKYPLYNKNYLTNIINEMTNDEKNHLLTDTFEELWEYLWGKSIGIQYRNEEKNSKEKFISLKLGITVNNTEYTLESLINESETNWEEPEWGFPKGRRNYQEKDIQCAIREFEEETQYNKSQLKLIQNLSPYEEIFTGSNYKSYRHKYYVAYMDIDTTSDAHHSHDNNEVGDMIWCGFEDALRLIRPYNLEKISVLEKTNKVLTEYRLYS